MQFITAALETLQVSLQGVPDIPGLRVFDISVPLKDDFDPLSWLSCQALYPQFYWLHRDENEEAAALGAVCHFDSLPEARAFLQQQARQDLRLWGLNAFSPERGQLFLPRLEWRRERAAVVLRLNLFSATSLHDDARLARAQLEALRPSVPLPALKLTLTHERNLPEYEGWRNLIEQATQAIGRGELEKVVLARASDLQFNQPVNASAVMAASRRHNLNCYHFMMAFDPHRAFLGSTPERLWRRRDLELDTEALAGTVANHQDSRQAARLAEWLMQDDKNQRENLLVLEDICQRLRNDVSALEAAAPEIIRLRKVQHLRRAVRAVLNRADDGRCLIQLQPTAAVAGLPREKARRFIIDGEPFDREWYAGSAGYLSLANSEFCVALRSASVTDSTVRLYAGAGIVAGSDPQQEWQEIEHKAAGLRSVLFGE
ncbi:isochorismate synthase MenF [uncultured Pluralibacter sp.]|uniref:isochorismate synthase MenF n=1 Tax=uncultured Pluralibacter sp. TaxID=1490864 RepID=UPI00260E8040|nr:isochorismate synthase MenF [uncultured Pluralibacter sp.]